MQDKIFIIEDDLKIRTELSTLLTRCGYICETSDDFDHMPELVLQAGAQLVLLDINLPLFDGYHLCRELRKVSAIPIIVVTSRNSELDELMSMNLGADDFLTKPYNTPILLARISRLLERVYHTDPSPTLTYKELTVDFSKSMAFAAGQQVDLTRNEARILQLLIKNAGRIVSRNEIMNDLWQSDEFVDDNTLTVNVTRLRKKLDAIGLVEFLETRRGQGYLV